LGLHTQPVERRLSGVVCRSEQAVVCREPFFYTLSLPFLEGRWQLAVPGPLDWGWLLVFSVVCTVGTYGLYLELLKRMSMFTINVVYNLEPVYGIVLAAAVFGSSEHMSHGFYWGAGLIVLSVLALPILRRWVGDKHKA
jgi:drug/metabolite transporter (DMT)-like permease